MRTKIVAGNWKMNMLHNEALELVKNIQALLDEHQDVAGEEKNMILIPPFPWIREIAGLCAHDARLEVGAQNCYFESKGAYTGEVSPDMILSAGAQYTIIGHSERRQLFHETHEFLGRKVDAALSKDLTPIFCCGEPLVVRENDNHKKHVEKQLTESLFHLTAEQLQNTILAYEPVWAIGTGRTATPGQAQEMHAFIRDLLKEKYGAGIAENISILYGGSVKPANAAELFQQQDVDGGLIGGASLKAGDFLEIYHSF